MLLAYFLVCLLFFFSAPRWLSIANLLCYYSLGWCCDLVNLFSVQWWSAALSTLRIFCSRTTLLTAAGLHRSCSPSGSIQRGLGMRSAMISGRREWWGLTDSTTKYPCVFCEALFGGIFVFWVSCKRKNSTVYGAQESDCERDLGRRE